MSVRGLRFLSRTKPIVDSTVLSGIFGVGIKHFFQSENLHYIRYSLETSCLIIP